MWRLPPISGPCSYIWYRADFYWILNFWHSYHHRYWRRIVHIHHLHHHWKLWWPMGLIEFWRVPTFLWSDLNTQRCQKMRIICDFINFCIFRAHSMSEFWIETKLRVYFCSPFTPKAGTQRAPKLLGHYKSCNIFTN